LEDQRALQLAHDPLGLAAGITTGFFGGSAGQHYPFGIATAGHHHPFGIAASVAAAHQARATAAMACPHDWHMDGLNPCTGMPMMIPTDDVSCPCCGGDQSLPSGDIGKSVPSPSGGEQSGMPVGGDQSGISGMPSGISGMPSRGDKSGGDKSGMPQCGMPSGGDKSRMPFGGMHGSAAPPSGGMPSDGDKSSLPSGDDDKSGLTKIDISDEDGDEAGLPSDDTHSETQQFAPPWKKKKPTPSLWLTPQGRVLKPAVTIRIVTFGRMRSDHASIEHKVSFWIDAELDRHIGDRNDKEYREMSLLDDTRLNKCCGKNGRIQLCLVLHPDLPKMFEHVKQNMNYWLARHLLGN
jgi:hypothetical protein